MWRSVAFSNLQNSILLVLDDTLCRSNVTNAKQLCIYCMGKLRAYLHPTVKTDLIDMEMLPWERVLSWTSLTWFMVSGVAVRRIPEGDSVHS